MRGRAVLAAYADTGANEITCPHCEAEPDHPCTKSDGRVSRVPCVDRLAAADLSGARSRTDTLTTPVVDYSEPRHPQEPPQ